MSFTHHYRQNIHLGTWTLRVTAYRIVLEFNIFGNVFYRGCKTLCRSQLEKTKPALAARGCEQGRMLHGQGLNLAPFWDSTSHSLKAGTRQNESRTTFEPLGSQ